MGNGFRITMHFAIVGICLAADSCPSKCKGMDSSGCNCGDRKDLGIFSCPSPNAECGFCASEGSFCKFDGTTKGIGKDIRGKSKTYACCDEVGKNPKHIACVKSKKNKRRFVCLPACTKDTVFLNCRDKNGRVILATSISCTGKSGQNKYIECPYPIKEKDAPRECGATGATCTKQTTAPIDDCCIGFKCEGGKCVYECDEYEKLQENPVPCHLNYLKKPRS